MVRETRHLWVGNLPDNIREDRIREHFKRYGRVQSVKLLPRSVKEETGENTTACTVAFMDIKSASKAHTAEHKIDERTLTTEYYEPAAIPSAASPQNTNSTYATSPGSTRFTNNHGTTEEHGNFPERFYERNNSRVTDAEYIRRTTYHDSRGRNRDRAYRNGPYNNVIDRHRPINSTWSYDSSRSYNSETGYGTTPSDTNDRRSSDSQSTKKKTKSRSGSRSVSPSGSASTRSPTRSRSQSSSSSSSSTTSQASSSTSSPKSRRVALSANASHQPVVHSDDRRPLAICVRNLPLRSSDTSLKDGLFHEYKKHGKVTWVKIVGQGTERHAIVCFKKPEDVDKALEVSYDKLFFGCKIEVAPYQGYDVDDNELRPYEAEIDEFHPKATRTLFIGNLEKDVTASDLRKHFDQFGEIIEIDIKKQGAVSSYAFCQYSDIISVVKAIRAMDGEHLGNNRIKLGFGKSMPTNCVWVDGVVDSVNEKYLTLQFDSFGPITQVMIDRDKGQGLIFYDQVVNAQAAVAKMRGVNMRGRKMQVDFASRECQEAFYEHLEKQGHVTDRANFEERREPAVRTFDATVPPATARFARYETPTRPRTASYSSRSNVPPVQCNTTAVVHSPSTPGSVTPRGTGSRSRLARFSEYYDQNVAEYGDRRYRSYDEYSQGSAASHEDGYEHEYVFNRESPSHADPLESRSLQHNSEMTLSFAPPDMRNLQKERYHLLEQLEEYPSSGDELVSPKKRIRLELLEGAVTNDVIIEANRDHRKVMEVRRTSEGSLKHHSRRPSVDSKHSVREAGIDRVSYMPHAVCKRRKTAGSDSSSRLQHHELSGSESVGSSRPGTPLCDEKPENFPTEPRRIPREREGPLSLPLPRFAAQVMGKGSVSVAGIKGQKENILSSPPPAATSPRICTPVTPSLAQVPPPASPPPRPPSLSSNSSDSDITPPSPSLDERIRSLDEKYEKWSGSRAVSAAGSEALAKLDASASERFRFSYKLLDLDLKELQPSEIVKSVLAKPSVFDEDSKRLENVGEKYDIGLFAKTPAASVQASVPASPVSAQSSVLKVATVTPQLPKTPTIQSPRSSGSNITTAKGLQYPFPSHPPLQPVISAPSTPTPPPLQTQPLPSAASRVSHSDNRLKLCANTLPGDSRTSKLSVTRSGSALTSTTQVKGDSNTSKNGVNIPVNSSDSVSSAIISSNIDVKVNKSARENKLVDKSDKIANRRDSVSSGGSPRSEISNRRNSENSGRKSDVGDNKQSEHCDSDVCDKKLEEREKNEEWKREQQRLENERIEKERVEKERIEKERVEKERLEKERIENERLERERLEKERLEKEKLEKERLERELKREREEKERKEREERERREREEQEKLEREKKEKREKEEREKRERDERERKEREEQERLERERKREEERKHKEDNHEKRRDEHSRHRDNHGESKHKETSDSVRNERNTKDSKSKEGADALRKDSNESRSNHENKNNHESSRERHNSEIKKEDKNKHHLERDMEKKKDNCKENRENNLHEKVVNLAAEIKENNKPSIESRHFSIEMDKNKIELCRRKERNNSLPANVGSKRRLSSQDSLEVIDEIKKIKLSQEHRKITDRRDSKDVRSEEKVKLKHKNNIAKIIEDKLRQEKFNNVKEVTEEKRRDKERDKDEKHKHKQKLEKQKSKEKSRDKDSPTSKTPNKDMSLDKEFLARLDLQSIEESEKIRQRKDIKEKRKQENSLEIDDRKVEEHRKSEDRKKEKRASSERKSRDENPCSKTDDRKNPKKERTRKITHSSDAATDSDEPKKQQPHSIFDIVDDEPAYISMYDKVKARSCKNMQKQEEEKRQEKLKAKFSQLKQSRAKREEKKRSTSWDEDSDSDHDRRERSVKSEGKSRKSSKVLITSSDDDTLSGRSKQRKKRDIYTDSDSDKHRTSKNENAETSDDENAKNKSIARKTSKSRIASDTSDDDFKTLRNKIKSEIFSDSELDHPFIDLEEKPHKKIKDEDGKYVKKEKRNKHQELTTEQISAQIFGESPVPDTKPEPKFDNSRIFGDVSSAEDTHEVKKEKNDVRRKHKKKQKRQKHSITSEEDAKLELTVELIKDEGIEKMKNSEKKKQHSKKDKKKDKIKDDEKHKEKSRKSKKSKSELGKCDSKRDGKMENIFGSFSDDSEHGSKDPDRSDHSFLDRFGDEKLQMYASDSDSISHIEKEIQKSEEKEQRKEEHKKRKEKKRREKEKRLREEEINENSMDYIDMGKQLEANIKDDSDDVLDTTTTSMKSEGDERGEDIFRFTEGDESQEIKIEAERREVKEKKKKRKKSKEEKHKHHHHHHDKNKVKSPDIKKEFEESVTSDEKPTLPSPSLPTILELSSPSLTKPSSPTNKSVDYTPPVLVNCVSKAPTPKEKKRDKLIPGFGTEIDEKVHETAIKSISEFEPVKQEVNTEIKEEPIKLEKPEPTEEKPRVVISQEETEDAVAALLGESFGGNEYSSCYSDEQQNLESNEPDSSVPEDNIAEDLEEMRQAVQSLNSTDLEIKPDTPQSEHELQIDTDTDEQEEISLRYDHPPKTPDMVDLSQPPKTPDIPNTYFRSDNQTKTTLVIKATSLNSPPSLTPIKPLPLPLLKTEAKSVVENLQLVSKPTVSIPEPLRTLPPQKVINTVSERIKSEAEPSPISSVLTTIKSVAPVTSLTRSYTQPVLTTSDKPTVPSLSLPPKPELIQTSNAEVPKIFTSQPAPITKPSATITYNIPLHVQYASAAQQKPTVPAATSMSAAPTTTISFNRLPITPVMMPKSFHQSTMSLPQPITAKSDTLPSNILEQPRVSTHPSNQSTPPFLINSQSQTRMVLQNVAKPIPSQTTTRLITPINYSYPPVSKPISSENPVSITEPPRLVPTTYPSYTVSSHIPPSVLITPASVVQTSTTPISKPHEAKPFIPVIHEAPRLVSLSSFNTSSSSIIQSTSKLTTVSPSYTELKPKPLVTNVQETKPNETQEPLIEVKEPVSIVTKQDVLEPVQKSPEEVPVKEVLVPKPEVHDEPKDIKQKVEEKECEQPIKTELENVSVIKKTDKYDDDKGETESIESDISKERLSADLVNKDDGLDSKEDSDYWSAKEVNIDSVIKKVDALCSADELSDRSSEIGKDDWFEHEIKPNEDVKDECAETPHENKIDSALVEDAKVEANTTEEETDQHLEEKEAPVRGGRRGGRGRGRKTRGVDRGGVQTRRAKVAKEEPTVPVASSIVVSKRGGRAGRCKNERKTLKCEIESSDVYEFRDDADEHNVNKDRPRLILTIKSPVTTNANNGSAQSAVVKEVINKECVSPKPETKEDFVSPTNTRKSRRLQERDVSRNTVDDTIEDVVRNTAIATRSMTSAPQLQTRRSARQTANKVIQETPRKSPRSGVRRKDRRGSENTDDSSEEKFIKNENASDVEVPKLPTPLREPIKEVEEEKVELPKEKPHEGLKAAVLRRVKGEMNQQEPMTLIDPVTGLLTPMRECEEGRYIPVSGTLNQAQIQAMKLAKVGVKPLVLHTQPVSKPVEPLTQTVITTSPVIQQQKPQSLKAHVLSSQAARVVVSQPQQPQKVVTIPPAVTQAGFVTKPSVPISQHLNVNVSSPSLSPAHISPRSSIQPNLTKTIHALPPGLKVVQQQAPPSPNQSVLVNQPKQQHILQPVNKQPQATISKGHHVPVALSNVNQQMVNTQLAHMKQVVGKGPAIKPHGLHPQPQILTGAVASPPLKQTHLANPQQMATANAGRLIQGSASVPSAGAKGSMEPPKVEVSIAGCVMVPHPSSSPQGQQRHVLPITTFEANLGEGMAHFPPGSVKLRTPHDLLPAHYMHPQHVMYQQYLRQSYHLPRSPLISGNIEKAGDGQEGEEAPVELRRPGSVGLALTGRAPAVPLSLQSPHDRTTDSPQVGQVYNMHNSRLQQHYHPGRYYEQATEPPPAHRPLTSHGSLAALGNDRSLSHIGPLNATDRPLATHLTSDRPLSSHLPPERPLSSHLPPDRPLSSHTTLATSHINSLGVSDRPLSTHLPDRPLSSNHGFPLGTGLGAAGNLMGAVARHVGAEAPASQRGLQAATPPHASQVPPQAESLLMLLKQYPCMWQGLLALKNDQAAVQMYFVSGNDQVAKCSLPKNTDGSTPPLRIFQRMRLEPPQVEGVARKMQMENEHCMLLALPCGHDHMDVLKQSTNLSTGFITYLQQKQAAGIVNVAAPGTTQPPAYVVHIFPSCDFVNENLRRIAPNLLERVSDIAHLLIVITTV
ncbi:hypothetical protein RN001_013252 [Aquatica leii]|uniref:Msx2-interacting protein n=1 Tax=Aquatica leii TaxID=1421715 RepID=A0AAN7PRJ1_9COLE|nr:hypothetical protein RN001_013252 [Aquatica leii]